MAATTQPWTNWQRGMLNKMVDPHWVDFVLGHVSPTVRLARVLARVVAVRSETADIKTFVVRPNLRFGGFVPGQYVPVRVEIGGVVHERCYSLTSRPGAAEVSFAVKRVPGGKVSNWLHDKLQPGAVIELGQAGGDYVLPAARGKLLLIAGGSGITPNFALVQAALAADPGADAALLYYARSDADFAFADALKALTAQHPGLQVHFLPETGANAAGRFSPAQLAGLVPDAMSRQAYVCGPAGLMDAVQAHWEACGARERLRSEVFGLAPGAKQAAAVVPVNFRRSQRTVENNRPTLLETAEAAGMRPASGCRMGICKTCVCTKVSGVVRDKVTGAVDATPNARIKLCVSEPLGPVTLDL